MTETRNEHDGGGGNRLNPESQLTRKECAAALTEADYPTTVSGLATRATRGDGPPLFRKIRQTHPVPMGARPWSGPPALFAPQNNDRGAPASEAAPYLDKMYPKPRRLKE